MKALLRIALSIALLGSLSPLWAQPCTSSPTISNTTTSSNIGTTYATVSGNVTSDGGSNCVMTSTGAQWSTTAGGPYTNVTGTETGTGGFSVDLTGLPSGTRIYFRVWGRNDNGDPGQHTRYSTENSFYTLADEPDAHAASLTATTLNNDQIHLEFPPASDIPNADGYVILMEAGSNPNTNNLNDGSQPNGASDYLHLLNSSSATDYTVSGLNGNTEYRFTIVPYNRSGHDNTYNYLTSLGYPFATATTDPEVDVDPITGNLAPVQPTRLASGTTDRALVGFAVKATGTIDFQGVVINLSSTTSGKFENFRLCASTNNTFDGVGTDAPLSGVTITPSAGQISISLSQSFSGTRYFFLVADVTSTVSNTTPNVIFSYNENNFTFSPANLAGTGAQSREYSFRDGIAPTVLSKTPAHNATGIPYTLNKLVLNFDENVDNVAGADQIDKRVWIVDAVTHNPVAFVERSAVIANGTTTVEVPVPPGTLQPNTTYYVEINDGVIEDIAGNDWTGITAALAWTFTTSGVTVNNETSAICDGSFQSISDIVISEQAAGDFMTSGSVHLDFADANFVYDISSVTVSAGPAGNTDITSISLSPKTLTRLTLNFTLDGTNDKVDVITISGLKVYASSSGSTTIRNGNSVSGIWAIAEPITFATINVGTTTPPAPTLVTMPAQDVQYCAGEDISATTVSVLDDGGTFLWFSNSSLSTLMATGATVSVQSDLGISSAAPGTTTRYVVRVDGCRSTALAVTFEVLPVPVADAGPASTTTCSGSPVTLGGSPTLVSPSTVGSYQYLWSTNPPGGFTDLGPNPVVTPVSGKDTTIMYTVKIVDANGCASDILDPNATIAIDVDSTDQPIVYNSPLGTNFTLNSDPVELDATPSIDSYYSGNGVYLSQGKYYFDPDLAGTAGSPHAITYSTKLDNGCRVTDVRNFGVTNSSGSIVNLANSYCQNELPDASKVLALGAVWASYLASDNAYYQANYGYTYEFYDFQTYVGSNVPGTGVLGAIGNQYIDPQTLQPYVAGVNYAYIGMRVRRRYPEVHGIVHTGNYLYDPPIFWMVQYVNIYQPPALKVTGIRNGQIVCNVNEQIELEANFLSGTFQISRDGNNWVSGPAVGIVDNPTNSGKALFNPRNAYTSTGFAAPHNNPASGITNFYIRYTYVVPNTSGSNSSACEATLVIPFQISNNPTLAWGPLAKTEFCYEDATATVSTLAPADPSQTDIFSGYGIFDNGNRTANFDPDEALKAKAFGTNSPPYSNYNSPEDIVISATRTDLNGCKTTITQTVKVRPLFPASFTQADLTLCYEDGPQNIVGDQPNGYFTITNPNLNLTLPQTTLNNVSFRNYFNQAVSNGADGSVMQEFNVTFHTSDPGLGCSNSVTKTFTVNPPIPMDIGGLTSGMVVCGNAPTIELIGNQPSAGTFEISNSPSTGFVNNAMGLNNTSSGLATFNPAGVGAPAGSAQRSVYIRYSFLGPGCVGSAQTVEEVVINPQPAISFSSGNPAANTAYCHEQGDSPTTVTLSTNQSTNVTFQGFGITDNGNGSAIFNPTSGYQQSSLADNLNPLTDQTVRNIVITARRVDALSCSNTTSVTYVVNPLPPASFTPPASEFCYEEDPVVLQGAQTNVKWQFIYRNTTPANYEPAPLLQSTVPFDPQVYFNDAVAHGANALATLQFDVVYTAVNNTTGCTNTLAPVSLKVSPRIPVAISGVEDSEIFCSNSTDRLLEFSPPGGTFRLNGVTQGISNNQFLFNPAIDGPQAGTDYTFTYEVLTGSNCTNTLHKTVKVLPSPVAQFAVSPQCEGELISYHAESGTNLPTAIYTWTFSGVVKTGQDVDHRFPGVSSYYAKLKVEHPPFYIDPSTSLVCADSLQLDQTVGPYPEDIRFEYYNVCEDDATNFEVFSNFPINRVSWDFGDGVDTGFGILSEPVSGAANTNGLYQAPVHKYTGSYDALTVRVTGKTSDDFGGCAVSTERVISILKKWEPSGGELRYDMAQLDGGKGFWVAEDRQGNASWDFNTAIKTIINTNEKAWVTGAVDPYNGNDVSYVNSPCFDLTDFSRPVISLRHWTDTEPSDGAVLQYSVDGGNNWYRLGDVESGIGWYNRLTISANPGNQTNLSSGWSLNNQLDWVEGKHTLDVLPQQREKVRFRIAFSSFNNLDKRDGFAFNNVVIEERNRTILMENFTTLNPAQHDNNELFKAYKADNGEINPTELVKLQYHHAPAQSTSPPDELHLANPTDQNARAAFYGVTNASRAFVDGGFGQTSPLANYESQNLDLYFSLRSLVTSPVSITIDFDDEPSDLLNIRASVRATTQLSGTGHYNVFIAVAEKSVSNQVYVLRKFLPDASGTRLTSTSPSDPAQEINVSYDMRHVTRLGDGSFAPFAVIVFVQDIQTKDVLQTAMRQDGIASPDIITGVESPYDRYIQVYPNPADEFMTIELPGPAEHNTWIKVFDSFGREVIQKTLQAGDRATSLNTRHLSSGVYLIQIGTPGGMVQKKAMISHK